MIHLWRHKHRIFLGLGLLLLCLLTTTMLTQSESDCRLERYDSAYDLFVQGDGGLTFYRRHLSSSCYMVVMYLDPKPSLYSYPGGFQYQAHVIILGGRTVTYTSIGNYRIVRYSLVSDCTEAVDRGRQFLDQVRQLGMFALDPSRLTKNC